jgi:alcohol dehydrogenase class IV
MDGGKAICLTATSDTALWDFEFEHPAPDLTSADFPPLITIPTTAGTGAETESTAMVTDTTKGMKFCIWHEACKPACALLDPELTLGLPPHLTAWTGVDAMVHAIEAYCVPGFHPLCDGMALEGLRLIAKYLPVAHARPDNLEARGAMLVGSCLAGIAFLKGLGLVHAISHMVGAEHDTHHGLTNAVLLPSILRFNAPDIQDRIEPMAQAMGLSDTSFDGFYAAVCALLDQVEIPRKLGDINVPDDGITRLAEKALQDSAAGTNPRSLTTDRIEAVIRDALETGR